MKIAKIRKKLRFCGGGGGFPEKYAFEWPGKRDALRAVGRRSAATLRPVPEESVDFETTRNVYIEGDNLEVLRLLQESYFRKVKMIYIDPPYNTGNDFVYNDDFADPWARYLELTSQTTKSNPETAGRFHSNWLNMIYPRLRLAANLLRDDGVIFISIDDREVCNLRKICDEIFGEENFVAQVVWQRKTGASDAKGIATITEYILCYSKNNENIEKIFSKNTASYDLNRYRYQDQFVLERGPYYIDNLDRGGLQYSDSLNYAIECPDGTFTFPNGRTAYENDGWIWKWSKEKIKWARKNGFLEFRSSDSKKSGWSVCYKNYLKVDNENKPIVRAAPHKNLVVDILNANAALTIKNLFGSNVFPYSKPYELLCRLMSFVNFDADDIILDFFSGSGTTAHAAMKLNAEDGGARRFILVQLPELCAEGTEAAKAGYRNICEIGKERIRRAGTKLREERADGLFADDAASLDVGFKVFRLDTSNWELWDDSPTPPTEAAAFLARLRDSKNARKPDRSDADVLTEVALKSGLPLDAKFETLPLVNVAVYVERGARFGVLLQDGAKVEDVERLLEAPPSERPEKIVVAESAFRSDAALANVAHLLAENGIEAKFI